MTQYYARRPQYAKGSANRERIIEKAVQVFGRAGYRATSMREIASECGLSQAGLLHYFPNKEALLLAIVEERDRAGLHTNDEHLVHENKTDDWERAFLSKARENIEQEGLTRLWSSLAGEAADPGHPAHEYFQRRYRISRSNAAIRFATLSGRSRPNSQDKIKAALLLAVWDGLQSQWLIDETFDMMPAFKYAIKMIDNYSKN